MSVVGLLRQSAPTGFPGAYCWSNLMWRILHRTYSTRGLKETTKYVECFQILGLPNNSSKDLVRRAYIELVKKYHPDTNPEQSKIFSEIDAAYRTLQAKFRDDKRREEASVGEYGLYYQEKSAQDDSDEQDDEHPDINHTAPQHRQYLENEGFGFGSPSQRQKQHQKYRAYRANQAVFEHRIDKLTAKHEDRLVTRERKTVKRHATRSQIERVVEDLIQESMKDGKFDNLAGSGSPLPERVDYNPYADFTTHKMNQILVEGGFAPEWVRLRKDIVDDFDAIRKELRKYRQTLGPGPLDMSRLDMWIKFCDKLEKNQVRDTNERVNKFNLIVPMLNSQLFHFNLRREAEKVLETGFDPAANQPPLKQDQIERANGDKQRGKGILQEFIQYMLKSR